jgi:hypothetical protein
MPAPRTKKGRKIGRKIRKPAQQRYAAKHRCESTQPKAGPKRGMDCRHDPLT